MDVGHRGEPLPSIDCKRQGGTERDISLACKAETAFSDLPDLPGSRVPLTVGSLPRELDLVVRWPAIESTPLPPNELEP